MRKIMTLVATYSFYFGLISLNGCASDDVDEKIAHAMIYHSNYPNNYNDENYSHTNGWLRPYGTQIAPNFPSPYLSPSPVAVPIRPAPQPYIPRAINNDVLTPINDQELDNIEHDDWYDNNSDYIDPYDNDSSNNYQSYYQNSPPDQHEKPLSEIYFAPESSKISAQAIRSLQRQAAWLRKHPHHILITGYTDNRGSRDYNIALGKQRAEAVRHYLAHLGVPTYLMRTLSYGAERPCAICHAEHCWARNRRVTIMLP